MQNIVVLHLIQCAKSYQQSKRQLQFHFLSSVVIIYLLSTLNLSKLGLLVCGWKESTKIVSARKQQDMQFPQTVFCVDYTLMSWNWILTDNIHCVKSVQIRSIFWSVFSCIRTEYGDLDTEIPNMLNVLCLDVVEVCMFAKFFNVCT